MNKCMLIGNIVRDIEVKQAGETSVAKFTVAVKRNVKNKEGKYDSDFLNCVAFGKTGENINKYFGKGSKIGLTGRVQTGSYTDKNGQKKYTFDIIVDDFDFIDKKDSTPAKDDSGFENIPEGIDEELPFN